MLLSHTCSDSCRSAPAGAVSARRTALLTMVVRSRYKFSCGLLSQGRVELSMRPPSDTFLFFFTSCYKSLPGQELTWCPLLAPTVPSLLKRQSCESAVLSSGLPIWTAHLDCLHSLLNKDVCPTRATHSDSPREGFRAFFVVFKVPQDS